MSAGWYTSWRLRDGKVDKETIKGKTLFYMV